MAKGMLPIAADGGARFPPLSSLPSTDARQADKHCRRAPPFPPGGNDDADDDQHVVLRPCAHEPIETLRDVHEAVFPIKFEDAFFEQLASGRFRTIGAYLPDNRLVGIAVWEVTSCWQADRYDGPLFSRVVGCGDSRDRHAVYIMTLGVRAGLRRQGIGRALLDACVSSARDTADCACVYLHVLASNSRAVRMYTGAQFLCLHTLPRFYPASTFIAPAAVDGIDADAHVFARYLRDGVPPASLRLLRSWRLACALLLNALSGAAVVDVRADRARAPRVATTGAAGERPPEVRLSVAHYAVGSGARARPRAPANEHARVAKGGETNERATRIAIAVELGV